MHIHERTTNPCTPQIMRAPLNKQHGEAAAQFSVHVMQQASARESLLQA